MTEPMKQFNINEVAVRAVVRQVKKGERVQIIYPVYRGSVLVDATLTGDVVDSELTSGLILGNLESDDGYGEIEKTELAFITLDGSITPYDGTAYFAQKKAHEEKEKAAEKTPEDKLTEAVSKLTGNEYEEGKSLPRVLVSSELDRELLARAPVGQRMRIQWYCANPGCPMHELDATVIRQAKKIHFSDEEFCPATVLEDIVMYDPRRDNLGVTGRDGEQLAITDAGNMHFGEVVGKVIGIRVDKGQDVSNLVSALETLFGLNDTTKTTPKHEA